tara:strand:+ start:289 stop:636 length:348 start_codon:yes stop_codon:yes gene_type:complete
LNSSVAIGLLLYFVTHIIIWFQVNGQFVWPWAKANPWLMSILGLPISYVLIIATKYIVAGFDGLLWPGRLVGFGSGMIVMAVLTWGFMGEGINLKTLTSLILATGLVCVQVFWKI